MASSFLAFDTDHDNLLSFDEFRRFLEKHPDVLQLSTALMHDRLQQADLLQPLSDAVGKIKHERSQSVKMHPERIKAAAKKSQ